MTMQANVFPLNYEKESLFINEYLYLKTDKLLKLYGINGNPFRYHEKVGTVP